MNSIRRFIRKQFARYMITDCHGTEQYAWTYRGAIEWLCCGSDSARIVDLYKMEVLCWRTQVRIY